MIICPWKDIRRYAGVIPGLEEAIAAIESMADPENGTYPLSNGCKFIVKGSNQKPVQNAKAEAHREFLDVQYVLSGEEYVGWAPVDTLTPDGEFNTEKDVGFYSGQCQYIRIPAGYCYVVFPEDAHAPDVYMEAPSQERKIVIKLKV